MPVHPWQWDNKLSVTFAAELARRHIVHLGIGADSYQAQQSIRTFFNTVSPGKCYVKTAMSVLNMGFMRGLSPQYMKATPAINDWLDELIRSDATLQQRGLKLLREIAAVGYTNRYFEAGSPKGSAYRKMLSALWRESPLPRLDDGEQLATMAALLHTDTNGQPLVSALIRQSGLDAEVWLKQYLQAYLVPLLHCFYAYELAYMPHGENLIMVLRDGAVQRMIMKDIAEEIVVMGDRTLLPEDCARVRTTSPRRTRCCPSSPTSSTASSGSWRHCWRKTDSWKRSGFGRPWPQWCTNTRTHIRNWPPSSPPTICSPTTSCSPA